MDRVKTGVQGLDKLIKGGLPRGLSVLVAGTCGTGKTILTLQYLYRGALEGETGLYVTFEESMEKILSQGLEFGWDLRSLMGKGLLDIYVVETDDMEEILGEIKDRVARINAKRLVLDSITTMMDHAVIYRSDLSREFKKKEKEASGIYFPSKGLDVRRKDIYAIIGEINRLGTTALLISEAGDGGEYISRDTISEFACDGVLQLKISELGGEIERLLCVRKMRGTDIDMTLSPLRFTESGIVVEE